MVIPSEIEYTKKTKKPSLESGGRADFKTDKTLLNSPKGNQERFESRTTDAKSKNWGGHTNNEKRY